MPVARHPQNRNSVIVADLAADVRPLIEWDVDRLRDALFGADRDDRPGLKEVRFNRCPFVAPIEVLRDQDSRRLEIDMAAALGRFEALRAVGGLASKIAAVYDRADRRAMNDADEALYDGFIGDDDRAQCAQVLTQVLGGDPSPHIVFSDGRLNELLFRMRARRDETILSPPEQARWREWLKSKLVDGGEGVLTLQRFRRAIDELDAPTEIVHALTEHADAIARKLGDPS
jgi:exodeoxyribonuclease-1